MEYEANNHSQVLVDGPSEEEGAAVPRHAAGLSYMSLTGIVIPKLPRGIGHSGLKKKWDEHEVEKKWNESNFAKSRQRSIRRKQLSDFERFKVMRLRKQVCDYEYGVVDYTRPLDASTKDRSLRGSKHATIY